MGSVFSSAQGQTRVLGVDVSDFQNQNSTSTPIDWVTAHKATSLGGGGKDFAFIRSTRGGTSGTYNEITKVGTLAQRYDDYAFIYNITNATSAGVLAGPYHFQRADIVTYTMNGQTITHTGADEANHMMQIAGPFMRPGYLLPVLDLETGAARTADSLANFSVDFGQTIFNSKGIWPIVYSSSSFASDPALSGNASGEITGIVSQKMPNLWIARWPNNANPGSIDTSTEPPAASGYPNVFGVWNPAYPVIPNPSPWKFWQYASTMKNIPGILGNANGACDVDVAHGGIEFVKDYLVPALWTGSTGGDWGTIANWNSDNPGYNPSNSALGPAPRLPGGNDTVVLSSTAGAVTLSSGTQSIRKIYVQQPLVISGGALAVTYAPSSDSTTFSGEFSNSVTISGSGSISIHTLVVDPAVSFNANGGTITFNTISLTPSSATAGRITMGGDVTFSGLSGATATISSIPGVGQFAGSIDLNAGTRTFTVPDNLAVNVPINNGGMIKAGLGTMILGGTNSFANGTTVSQGYLRVTGNGQLGSGTVTVQQPSTNGGCLQLSGNVSYGLGLTLNGGGPSGTIATAPGSTGELDNLSGANTWSGTIALAGAGNNASDTFLNQIGATAGTLVVSGVISNPGNVSGSWAKTGNGDLVLGGAGINTYKGLTRVFGGRLIIEKDAALGAAGDSLGATGNTFQLSGAASTIAFRAPVGSGGFSYNTVEWIHTDGTGATGQGQIDNLGGSNTFAGNIGLGGTVNSGSVQSYLGVSAGSLELSGKIYARSASGER